MSTFLTTIGDALSEIITWLGNVVTAITSSEGALGALMPFLAISIGISILMLGIRVLRGFIWGD